MAFCLTAQNLSKHFAARLLFEGVSISLDTNERLALIGPNGSGKSTLLKILAGLDSADDDAGQVVYRKGLRTAYVAQQDSFPEGATLHSAMMEVLVKNPPPHCHDQFELELAADMTLAIAGFEDPTGLVAPLSGGQRKRLAIARQLATDPHVLMLDEPTNHLDVEGIAWLEELLKKAEFSSIVVTHDRAFLESTATRIVELSRAYPNRTLSVAGNYEEFLRRKDEFLEGQAKQEQALAAQVKEDIRWLSRGAKARRTKSKARIDRSYLRMDELAELKARNAPVKSAHIDFTATDRLTHKLLTGRGLNKTYGQKVLFQGLDLVLTPGSKLGLMGPNGSGKSTLIKMITGEIVSDGPTAEQIKEAEEMRELLPPSTPALGTIKRADNLRTVVFSQHRTELDPEMTLAEALTPVDSVIYRGRTLHIATWADMFLFKKDQLRSPMKNLSGGEQARVHIARLMLEPADVLILDEPTNDLDIPSLEVLEESLEDFPGAIVLVTHDRSMLDRLATSILALDGKGGSNYYADFAQWQTHWLMGLKGGNKVAASAQTPPAGKEQGGGRSGGNGQGASTQASGVSAGASTKKKLSFNEQRERDKMQSSIEQAENLVAKLEAQMNDPKIIADHKKLDQVCRDLGSAQERVAKLYVRWEELESRA